MFCVLASILLAIASATDKDIILPPVNGDTSLPERLLVFIPGGKVPNQHYKETAMAIQNATTGLRLTVVIPGIFKGLCIIQCASTYICAPLKHTVDAAVAKAAFKSSNPKQDTFVAGHSLGATCANTLVAAYSFEYAGLMEFGGYVDKTGAASVANYAIPVMHMAGELDGGGARPGKLSFFYQQFKEFAAAHDMQTALTRKPVHVLPGLDHSDFCPGFFVTATKDIHSEVTQDVALAAIGNGASAFLHLNSPVSADLKTAAMTTMEDMLKFTAEMCDPYLEAFALEQSGGHAPWCKTAQRVVSGLDAADVQKLTVDDVLVPFKNFEHSHTNYTQLAGGGLEVTCFGAVEPSTGFGPNDIHQAAKSIDCKMVDATRVAEQMKSKTNTSVQCGEINKLAVAAAEKLLTERSRTRYEAKGRKWCFQKDSSVFENIGPLFVKGSITMTETAECMEVSSLALISTISSMIFPGNHYCKLLSPAMAMEWMMTDSLKPFPYHEMDVATDVSAPTLVV